MGKVQASCACIEENADRKLTIASRAPSGQRGIFLNHPPRRITLDRVVPPYFLRLEACP